MISETLERIKYHTGKFKEEEVQTILNNREKFEPYLLNLLDDALADPWPFIDEEREDFVIALYVLSFWKSGEAFEKYIKLFSLENETLDELFGDIVTEDLEIFFFRTCHGQFKLLQSFASNVKLNEYARGAALQALSFITLEQPNLRSEIVYFFEQLLRLTEEECEDSFSAFVVSELVRLGSVASLPLIEKSFKLGMIDTTFINLQDVHRSFSEGKEACEEKLRLELQYKDHTDLEKSMKWMSCYSAPKDDSLPIDFDFMLEKQKIGRNDPCPCESGKKYKKCCLS